MTESSIYYTQDTSAVDNIADFSSIGASGARQKPEMAAPGASVISAKSDANLASNINAFSSKQGTSMATPSLAAAAGLVVQYFTSGYYPTGAAVPGNAVTPKSTLVRAILAVGARAMTGGSCRLVFTCQG